jgi:hypothetical protein
VPLSATRSGLLAASLLIFSCAIATPGAPGQNRMWTKQLSLACKVVPVQPLLVWMNSSLSGPVIVASEMCRDSSPVFVIVTEISGDAVPAAWSPKPTLPGAQAHRGLMLRSSDTSLEIWLAVARSGLPSPLKSPTATEAGSAPTAKLVAEPKAPLPSPSSTDTLSEL